MAARSCPAALVAAAGGTAPPASSISTRFGNAAHHRGNSSVTESGGFACQVSVHSIGHFIKSATLSCHWRTYRGLKGHDAKRLKELAKEYARLEGSSLTISTSTFSSRSHGGNF